jgi:hypothetical protein
MCLHGHKGEDDLVGSVRQGVGAESALNMKYGVGVAGFVYALAITKQAGSHE